MFNMACGYDCAMDYVVSGVYARRMLRTLRCDRGAAIIPLSWSLSVGSIRTGAYTPLTEEGCTRLGMQAVPTKKHPMRIIVPSAETRVQRHAELDCQVISSILPDKPFVKITPEVSICEYKLSK